MKALHDAKVPDTLRGPVRFDELGNVVGNVYIRKVEKKGGKYVNAVIKTYPDVSQFWTYEQGRVPEEPGLFARLPAGEESGIATSGASRDRAARSVGSPPPCGEGLGVGVP